MRWRRSLGKVMSPASRDFRVFSGVAECTNFHQFVPIIVTLFTNL